MDLYQATGSELLEKLDSLQDILDRHVLLCHAIEKAKEENDEVEKAEQQFWLEHPALWCRILAILVAVWSLWRADLIPLFSTKPQENLLDAWCAVIISGVFAFFIFVFLFSLMDYLLLSKKRTQEAKTYYQYRRSIAEATLRQAEKNLQSFENSEAFQRTRQLLPEKVCTANQLNILRQQMQEQKATTFEQGLHLIEALTEK